MNRMLCFYLLLVIFIVSTSALVAETNTQKDFQFRKQLGDRIQHFDNKTLHAIPKRLSGNTEDVNYQRINHLHNSSSRSRDVIDVKVNGDDQTTIVQGEDIVVTIYFSDNCFTAEISLWVDINGNGIWEDDIDILIPDGGETIIDNDLEDEDPTVGVYQFTMEGDDSPSMVANIGLFFVAEDTGGIDDAYVYVNPITSDYSVAGSVTPVAAAIIIMAMNEDEEIWMTITDTNGDYQNFVTESGLYYLMAFDALGVLPGMFSTTVYIDVNINGHITGYDFIFLQGNATIEGTVTDENGALLEGITVFAEQDEIPGNVWDLTDENGFYQISVFEGTWYLRFYDDELMPAYMDPEEIEVYIEEGNTEIVDLMLYETDSFIEGTVYLDGIPTNGFEIQAWNDEVGDSFTISGGDGTYDLPVASEADAMGGYEVHLDIWEIPGIYVDENYQNVMSGTTGIDFHVHTATGGLEGYIYDSVTLEPIDESWISAYDGTNFFGTGTDDGYYQLFLPNGTYEVWAEGDMYYQQYVEDVVIDDDYVVMDFYLDPITFEGVLEGFVYEEGTTNPIPFADLSVWNDNYWDDTTSDENGYYYFDMPNGIFTLYTWHPLYYVNHVENIEINNNVVTVDVELEPIIFDGAVEGFVYEEGTTTPIPYANIEVHGEGLWIPTMSDDLGFYHVDLPNGSFSLDCWKDGYEGTYVEFIEINNNTVILDLYLVPLVEAEDVLNSEQTFLQNYPNPFNPTTTINYRLPENGKVKLTVYNLKGQKVKQLISDQLSAGKHSIVWDGRDDNGKSVSSGIYFYKLKTANFEKTKKMILMK